VTIIGRLTAHDMGRLEHACAPALITAAPQLEIDLRRVTSMDPTALAVLQRMQLRGAILKTRMSGPSAA
jgi:anti-anti-sigma regulatory factor